jgi:hypothetical protein
VDRAAASRANVEFLDRAVARGRERLSTLAEEEVRARRADATGHVAWYVGLLRQATGTIAPVAYPLKLEFADGRWDVAESKLASKPQLGDVLRLANGDWCVRGRQLVHPSIPGKPGREFLVCAPA